MLVDLAFGNGVLIAVLRRRGEGNAVVIEEITLCDVDPGQPEVDALQLRRHATQRIARGGQPQHIGHGGFIPDEHLLAQEIVGHGVRSGLAAQFRELTGGLREPLLLAGKNLVPPQLVHQVAVSIALVVEDVVPCVGERIGQHAVEALQSLVFVVNLRRIGFGLSRGVGFGQLGNRAVIGKIAVHVIHGIEFQPLRFDERGIVGLRELFPEIGIADQIAHLERIGNLRRRIFRGRPRRLRRRAVQVGEHPLLLDGVDTVDQAALSIADFEYPAFELQNILRILLAGRRVLAQLPPGAFHGIDDRIFAHLQLRILAQKRHILLVAFEPRDAGFD